MPKVVLPYLKDQERLYIQTLHWPEQCACCGGEATEVYGLSHNAESEIIDTNRISYYPLNWKVPYCRTCLRHVKLPSIIDLVLSVGVFAFWAGIGYIQFLMGLEEDVFAIAVFVVSLPALGFIGYRLRKPLHNRLAPTKPACSCQNCAIKVTSAAEQQQVTVTFFNEDYANAFVKLNDL